MSTACSALKAIQHASNRLHGQHCWQVWSIHAKLTTQATLLAGLQLDCAVKQSMLAAAGPSCCCFVCAAACAGCKGSLLQTTTGQWVGE